MLCFKTHKATCVPNYLVKAVTKRKQLNNMETLKKKKKKNRRSKSVLDSANNLDQS